MLVADALLLVGVAVAGFVGFNIGGSNTGVAFGPAVGCNAVSKLLAGVLMAGFALLGGWTVGRNVVETLGSNLVAGDPFTPAVSIAVLFFIGFALFVSNLLGVPASTSMTAVGAIAGLGLATGSLNVQVVLEIVSWWLLAPVLGFWASAVIGRYWYADIAGRVAIDRSGGPLFVLETDGGIPQPTLGPGTTQREAGGTLLVVVIGCYMAFSAGASNVANAVAPLVGSGSLAMNQGILLAGGAIGLGALTIARRTLDTVGNDLTNLPIVAALVVAVVSASLVTVLSWLGIPASFVVIATMSIVGLGWGRATRNENVVQAATHPTGALQTADAKPTTVPDHSALDADSGRSVADAETDQPACDSEDDQSEPDTEDLYRPTATARVVVLQNVVPGVATVASYFLFRFVPLA